MDGARVFGIDGDIAVPWEELFDSFQLCGDVLLSHGHKLEATHHHPGWDHGRRRWSREHGGVGCEDRRSATPTTEAPGLPTAANGKERRGQLLVVATPTACNEKRTGGGATYPCALTYIGTRSNCNGLVSTIHGFPTDQRSN